MAAIIESNEGIRWRVEYRPCPICLSEETKIIGSRGGLAHRGGKGVETTVVQCIDCKTFYTKPFLIPESNPYAKESASQYFYLHKMQTKIKIGSALAQSAEKVLGSSGSMLELGCGRGEMLTGAARRGWMVSGVEMTAEYVGIARSQGIKVECSNIKDCESLKEVYDVILLAAILEHLYDPLDTLRRVRNALRPGGLVYIDVPNEESLSMRLGNLYMRLRRRHWAINLSPTFPPFHVVGFSPLSLGRVLNAAGFRIHTMEVPRWINAMPNKTFKQKIERSAFSIVQTIGERIGMGDGITCWAVRE